MVVVVVVVVVVRRFLTVLGPVGGLGGPKPAQIWPLYFFWSADGSSFFISFA